MISRSLKNILLLSILFIIFTSYVNCAKTHDLKVIIMSTSKFWFNFRQGTNSLLIYDVLRKNGVRDEDIILMIPENIACNPRNNNPGVVCYLEQSSEPNLYPNAEIDYKSTDVNVYTLTNMLRGRYSRYTPRSKRLVTNKNTKILTYFTGHGGNGYIKMQDTDVMMDEELKVVLEESYIKNLYNEMLMISDSCSAATLYEQLTETSPNIFALGSSSRGEYSFSYGRDPFLNLSVVDKFSRANYLYLTTQFAKNRDLTLADLMKEWTFEYLDGHYSYTNTHPKKDQKSIGLKDFFLNQNPVKSRILEMTENDQLYSQLGNLLKDVNSTPLSDFKIENPQFI